MMGLFDSIDWYNVTLGIDYVWINALITVDKWIQTYLIWYPISLLNHWFWLAYSNPYILWSTMPSTSAQSVDPYWIVRLSLLNYRCRSCWIQDVSTTWLGIPSNIMWSPCSAYWGPSNSWILAIPEY